MQNLKFKKPEIDWASQGVDFKAHILRGGHFKMEVPKLSKKPSWFFVNDVSGKGLYLISEDHKEQEYVPNGEISIDFSFPEAGAYNYKGTVIWYSRLFTRQWGRGISKGTSVFENLLDSFKKGFPKGLMNAQVFFLSANNLNSLFETKRSSFKDAFDQIKEGKLHARALSTRISLSCGIKDEFPIVWFNDIPVGQALDKNTVEVRVKVFEQEVKDLLRNENLQISFKKSEIPNEDA